MDYTNGTIYKILNSMNDEIYVGSTCQPLSKRLAEHRRCARKEGDKHGPLYKLMNEQGIDTFYIELVIECPCENVEQLRKIEGDYIRKYATLNKRIEGRTKREWVEDNKEHRQEKSKVYYEQNKDTLLAQQKLQS